MLKNTACFISFLGFMLFPCLLSAAPKNIILLIGDGMGYEHVKAAGMYENGSSGSLCFESFAHTASATTYSSDSAITDSAASGTAIATGHKANNGVISIASPGSGEDLETLLEYFKARGKSTGLVTTTYLTHATPAVFAAHNISRNNTDAIARDYLTESKPNVLFGGGANGLFISSAVTAGYTVVTSSAELNALDTESASMVMGHFGNTHLPYELDGLGSFPHLSGMTQKALNILDNDSDGFFLMVEGGKIDHAAHGNDIQNAIHETIEFAEAVEIVYAWAQDNPDTLIIVTADHETGGLSVTANNGKNSYPSVSWSSGGHTAANVPVYAYGTNAELIRGILDNTDFFGIITDYEDILNVDPVSVSSITISPLWGEVCVSMPENAFSENVSMTVKRILPVSSAQDSLEVSGIGFDIELSDPLLSLQKSITITLAYSDTYIQGLDESKLAIAWYNETTQTWLPLESSVDEASNRVTCRASHLSAFALVQLKASPALSDVVIYPSPFKPSVHQNGITFANLTENSKIRIFNIAGELVKELHETDADGRLRWNARNDSGSLLASGVYIAFIKNSASRSIKKFAIIK